MIGFVDRVGGVLTAPRAALAAALRAPVGQGARDVGWLLALRVIAGETPLLWKGAQALAHAAPRVAVIRVLAAASRVLPDLLGVLIGAVVMSFFVGRGPARDRTLDLAAYAWVPYLAVQLAASLAFTVADAPPSEPGRDLVSAAALAWGLVVWALGLAAARRALPSEPAP